jgi:spore maturation protein CgeB
VILTQFGPVEFAVGADMLDITPQNDNLQADISKMGFGARVKAAFNIVTLGISYANGTEGGTKVDGTDKDDQTTNTMSGYCDLALGEGVLTLAGLFTTLEKDSDDYTQEHNQFFVSYAHPLPIDGATIKFGVSQASASNDDPGIEDSEALGFKVRLNYNF